MSHPFLRSGLFYVKRPFSSLSPKEHGDEKCMEKNLQTDDLLLCVVGFLCISGSTYYFAWGGSVQSDAWEASVQRFLFGHSHMWFVQTLVGFYLLIPVARQICADRKVLRYYLLLWLVFRFLLPQLIEIFHLYTFSAWINSFARLEILVGYFGYFILGYYLNEIDIGKWLCYFIYALGLAACCLTIVLTVWRSKAEGIYVSDWTSPGTVNVLVMSVSIFVFFKYSHFAVTKSSFLWGRISEYTFFIYMFHMFLIEKLNLLGITTISCSSAVSVPLMTVLVFALSLLGAFLAAHIPVVKKLVMLHNARG